MRSHKTTWNDLPRFVLNLRQNLGTLCSELGTLETFECFTHHNKILLLIFFNSVYVIKNL